MRSLKEKFTSRKFLACVAGFLTGITVLLSGNTVEGVVTVITSIVAYLIAEGYIDAKSVETIADAVVDDLEEYEDDELF